MVLLSDSVYPLETGLQAVFQDSNSIQENGLIMSEWLFLFFYETRKWGIKFASKLNRRTTVGPRGMPILHLKILALSYFGIS